jgi:hypothetical protein
MRGWIICQIDLCHKEFDKKDLYVCQLEARANKTLAAYDNAILMREMHDKIIGITPSNYAPELDTNYFLFQSGKRRAF